MPIQYGLSMLFKLPNSTCVKRSKLICSNITNQISKLIGEIIELGYQKHGGEEINTPS